MGWLICFSVVNLMLGCLLFKKFGKCNESFPCRKRLECHQHILKSNLGLLRLYSFSHLDSEKPMKILARTGAKG